MSIYIYIYIYTYICTHTDVYMCVFEFTPENDKIIELSVDFLFS